MLSKVREILLTKYIGSIVIAVLCGNALINLITAVLRIVFWFVRQPHTHTALGPPEVPFPWDDLVFSVTSTLLYLLVGYALARWLYPQTTDLAASMTDSETEQPPDRPELS